MRLTVEIPSEVYELATRAAKAGRIPLDLFVARSSVLARRYGRVARTAYQVVRGYWGAVCSHIGRATGPCWSRGSGDFAI